ncbi:DNRLRE domain-containing protein [Marinicrinis sediminis]|uniref:DNRLRE domain-containing protein n=1 Tax=Marinicrinis sediminis TaxID=1652465 RepID=A0ABW5RBI7_9BACL
MSQIKRMFAVVFCCIILIYSTTLIGFSETINSESVISDDSIKELNIDEKRERKNKPTKRVELVEERTLFSKNYLLEDGTYLAEVSLTPIHFEALDGTWHEINTKIINQENLQSLDIKQSKSMTERIEKEKEIFNSVDKRIKNQSKIKDKMFVVPQVPFDVQINENITKGYTISVENEKLSFYPVNANDSIGVVDSVYNNQIYYRDVWEHTDLELVVTNEGIKENLILRDESAPNSFSFAVNGMEESKSLNLLPSWLVDSSGEYREVRHNIVTKNKKAIIELSWNDEGLIYPITIDPSTTIHPYIAIYVDESNPSSTFSWPSKVKVGKKYYRNYNGPIYHYEYSYFRFPLTSLPKADDIISASMSLYAEEPVKQSSSGFMDVIGYHLTEEVQPSTSFGSRPGFTTENPSSIVRVTQAGTYNFNVTNMTKKAKSESGSLNIGLYTYANSNLESVQFYTSFHGDSSKKSKLLVSYQAPPAKPIVSRFDVNKQDISSFGLGWDIFDESGRSQTKYQIYGLKKINKYSENYVQQFYYQGYTSQNSHVFENLGYGDWRFMIRLYNGVEWTDWEISEEIKILKENYYEYNVVNQLTEIVSTNGTKMIFTYDQNGNLKNKIRSGISVDRIVPEGRISEWYSRNNHREDEYNDFLSSDVKEPERDIRSFNYDVDQEFLYVMIELGRIENYPTLYPHGYNNDNYFIYIPSKDIAGTNQSRNGTALGLNAGFEIASWNENNTTVHQYNNNSNEWNWSWTGDYEFDGISSSLSINNHNRQTTSAVLEMKIPLSYLPSALFDEMVILSASDHKDADQLRFTQ